MPVPGPSSLRLRLQRLGARHQPFYRIVCATAKAPRDGKFVEILGSYNPIPDRVGQKHISLNVDRIKYWLCHGAQPSERVLTILSDAEIIPPRPRRHLPRTHYMEAIMDADEDAVDEDAALGVAAAEQAAGGDERGAEAPPS
jgi:small subunit ribosomal protein S16